MHTTLNHSSNQSSSNPIECKAKKYMNHKSKLMRRPCPFLRRLGEIEHTKEWIIRRIEAGIR